MGDGQSSNTGIDLDTISISDLIAKKKDAPEPVRPPSPQGLRADPRDYRIFVNEILRKMKGRDAFLTFTRQVHSVNNILNMTYSSAADIAQVILKDLALTAQVLKLVNSSFYRHFSNKGIATISEAMIILGTDEVRQLAAGLKLFEMMKNMAGSDILKEKTLKGLQRSVVARQIAWERKDRGSDALPISALIYELGEYLVALFDPDSYWGVEDVVAERQISRAEASKERFGLSYSDLGRLVARKLNLPQDVVAAMKPVTQVPDKGRDLSERDMARCICAFIYELCDIAVDDNDEPFEQAEALTEKYKNILNIDMRRALGLIRMSREKVERHAELLDIEPVIKTKTTVSPGLKNKADLDLGMDQVEDALNKNLSIHEIFTRLIETMDRAFYFNQVIICIKNKNSNTMVPRFVRGEERDQAFATHLEFKIEPVPDTFNNAIHQRTDMVVRDTIKDAYTHQIPQWYIKKIARPFHIKGFAVFPVFVDGKIVSMIYVDWDDKVPALDRTIMGYISQFRSKIIRAFTLHSK